MAKPETLKGFMSLRQSLSADQKFAAICASIAVLLGAEAALLYSLSTQNGAVSPAPPPRIGKAAPIPTATPLVFSAPVRTTPGLNEQGAQSPAESVQKTPLALQTQPLNPQPANAPAQPILAPPVASQTPAQPSAKQAQLAQARAAFERGAAAIKAKKTDAALEGFREAARLAPEDFATRLNLALLYEAKQDPKNALFHLEAAAKLQPRNAAVWFNKSRAELALNRRDAGLKSLRQTLKLAPKEKSARALLAQTLVSGKQPSRPQIRESYALWSALAREDKNDTGAHLQAAALANDGLRNRAEAQKWLRLANKNTPRDPRAALLLAQLLVAQKQPAEAAKILSGAAKAAPSVYEIYPSLAEARLAAGDLGGAKGALETALLRLPPAKTAAEKQGKARVEGGLRLALGKVLGESKQPQKALAEFQKAGKLLPQSGEPDSLAAVAHIQLKKLDLAEKSLLRALQKEPKRDGDRRLLAQLYADLKQWDKADAQWKIYTRAQPKDAAALAIWSQIAAQRKDFKGQLQIAQKLTVAAPKDPFAWTQLGLLQKRAGDKAGALASFERLGRLQPQNPDSAFERARLHGELGNSRGEFNEWKTVLSARPDYGAGYAPFIASAIKAGESANARQFLARILAKKPENVVAISEILKAYEKSNQTSEAKAFLTDLVARDPKQKTAREVLASFASAKPSASKPSAD